MENDDNRPTKRVSFAPNPQIAYIYQDESTATKTSSFFSDAPMDITTELPDLKNLSLFSTEASAEFYNEKLEVKRQSLTPGGTRKKSLNPLDQIKFDYNQDDTAENYINSNDSLLSNIDKEDPSNKSLDQNKGSNLFWNAFITNKPRLSFDGSFDNQGTINSSFGVDELVNTIDLRKIIPQEVKKTPDITEFLASQGIRFLDETVIDGMRRDTLSKSKNVVDPALIVYYEYSLKERIDFLYNFSNFLIDKMKDLQTEINSVKDNIDISSINKDTLKRIRNDSRNKSKIDWYSLRKIYEIQFNKKILENRNLVSDTIENLRAENKRLEDMSTVKYTAIDSLKQRIHDLKNMVVKVDKESITSTDTCKSSIKEKKDLLVSVTLELERRNEILLAQQNEGKVVQKKILKLENEVSNLKKNLSIKNVGENQIEELKKMAERYTTIFGFRLVKLTTHGLTYEMGDVLVGTEFNAVGDVTRAVIKQLTNDPFTELACSVLNTISEIKLYDFVRKCAEAHITIQAIKKEITILKEKTRIEVSFINNTMYIRVFPLLSVNCIEFSIDKSLFLIYDGNLVENIKQRIGAVSIYIKNKINS